MDDIKRALGIDMPGIYRVLTIACLVLLAATPVIAIIAFTLRVNPFAARC